ncbi:MAG: VWA domain-containing protein [Myxococcaceae bacterium]|nr:VWA domain-containing protein [Myxococcaceae bacterium]
MRRALPPIGVVLVILLAGCPDDRVVKTRPPDVFVDTFSQQSATKVDVLWVVDNSGSMADEQENLAKNFGAFINLFTRGSIDYRIAVTTTDTFKDKGQFRGNPKILTPQTGNVEAAFASNIKVGINGSPNERGLEAALMALERQQQINQPKLEAIELCKTKCGSDAACIQDCPEKTPIDFLRPDAYLYLIFVSDEEDKSDYDVLYYWRAYEIANGIGNDGTVNAAAIVGPKDNTCNATYGSRYIALTERTSGEIGSICDSNFSVTLRKLANNAVGLKRKFALTRKPNVETLKVTLTYPCNAPSDFTRACQSVDDSACGDDVAPDALALVCTPKQGGPDGWQYEPETNVIFFAGESVPGLNAQIDVEYYEEGKGP